MAKSCLEKQYIDLGFLAILGLLDSEGREYCVLVVCRTVLWAVKLCICCCISLKIKCGLKRNMGVKMTKGRILLLK